MALSCKNDIFDQVVKMGKFLSKFHLFDENTHFATFVMKKEQVVR